MSRNFLWLLAFISYLLQPLVCNAGSVGSIPKGPKLYFGAQLGYGSTTWKNLVPSSQNQTTAMNISTPTDATEGGTVWGGFAGFEFNRSFAVEAMYMRFPDAYVYFDSMSLFSFNHNGLRELRTQTELVNFVAKIFLPIPRSSLRIYSSAGVAGVHRNDLLVDQWQPGPSFGVGLNSMLPNHLMLEFAGNYTAGFGESQLEPANSYIPFLYSFVFKLAYVF